MVLYYFINKSIYKLRSISFDLNGVVINCFSKLVNNDKYQIMCFIFLIS